MESAELHSKTVALMLQQQHALFVGQHGLTCRSWEAHGKQSDLRHRLSKHAWKSQGWKLNIQSNLLTTLSIKTCFLLNSLLKSWSIHHTLDEVQDLYTVVFFTADTSTPKKELHIKQIGRPLVQRTDTGCDCILQVFDKPSMQWLGLPAIPFSPMVQKHLTKEFPNYFHKDKRMYLHGQFFSAYELKSFGSNSVIPVYHGFVWAVNHLRVHNLDSFWMKANALQF